MQPMLARERGVLRHNNDRQKYRAVDRRCEDEGGAWSDPLHHIQSKSNTGVAAFPHSVPGFSQQQLLKITDNQQAGSEMLHICASYL